MNPQPNLIWRGEVLADWVDYNQHMRDAFYLLVFSLAGDEWMATIGMGPEGRARTGHSLFTVECHLNYLAEVRQGAAIEVRGQLLGHDAKRIHLFLSLHRAGEPALLACSEQLWLNVDSAGPKATPFSAEVAGRLNGIAKADSQLPRPEMIGRVIALPPAKPF